ncbi:beta-lactamase family protein [Paenibacillus sp. SYP-B3998]|uniref:Beta-lactamase family protein n=1 Tax=Paenibacillus sp. SYP-B3998 TaxID=2678564 RepID=A0A6G3ZU37_9BACL|nr:serine hydrolase domain-containing protein [Paenibacillus sp. SYP-B3998]NEW05101.1 beta-lactamase family protein [Paenibacillus sp. SYP-B3998]
MKIKLYKLMMIVTFTLYVLFSPFTAYAESDEWNVDAAKIDTFMESAINRFHIPGAALGIIKGDQTVYLKGYGFSGPEKTPVTPQTPFVLGSTSKSFTALAIMQLVEEGKIDLDAPIKRYLPWFRLADEEASKHILVKHLLNQTSGLSTYDGRLGMMNGNKSVEEHIRDLTHTSLSNPVGSVFQYSNLNYNILGGIVQAVSGEPFTQYVSNHIFKQLDMVHSYASPEKAQNDGLATGYQPVFGFMAPTKQLRHEGTVASGYLISSAEDMSNYLIAQINRGHFKNKTVLSEEGVELMHRPSSSMGDGVFYAMGWSVNKNVIFHNGVTENTYSFMVMNGDYGIVLLINANDFLISYDSIVAGINGILHGQERSQADLPDFSKTYLIVDLIVLIGLGLVSRSIYNLFKWKARFKATTLRIFINYVYILLFNLLLPIGIVIYLPKLAQAPWSVAFSFLPGLGQVLYFISILLLCMGLVKAVLIIRSMDGDKKEDLNLVNSSS